MDLLVLGQRALVVAGAAVARGDHQVPLDLGRLDERRPLEEQDRLFGDLVFDEVGAEPVDHLQVGRVEPGRLAGTGRDGTGQEQDGAGQERDGTGEDEDGMGQEHDGTCQEQNDADRITRCRTVAVR